MTISFFDRRGRPAIELDPQFNSWSNPVPRLWFVAQQRTLRNSDESLYGATQYRTYSSNVTMETMDAMTDEGGAANFVFWREWIEVSDVGTVTSDRVAEYVRTFVETNGEMVETGAILKAGNGIVNPMVDEYP